MLSILCLLFACSSEVEKEDNSEEPNDSETEIEAPPVTVSVQLLDITGGNVPEGITLTSDIEQVILDSNSGDIQVPGDSQFQILIEAENYVTHQFTAMSGQEDLSLVSYFAKEDLSVAMYDMLELEPNPEKGILIVALDNPNLSPAVGAVAEIDANHDGAFVMSGMGVDFSNTVSSVGGFVAFPNVDPGETNIEITPPDGKTCWFHAVGGEGATVNIEAQQATVAFFICD